MKLHNHGLIGLLRIGLLILLVTSCVQVVSASTRIVPAGGTVVIGETDLDITNCVYGNMIGWWSSAAPLSSPPSKIIVISNKQSFTVAPADFSGYTGNWYNTDGLTASALAFRVTANFDWRNYNGKNFMTPVRDQSLWGACWAFATIGSVEAKYNIEQGKQMNLRLSEWDLHYQIKHGVNAGAWPSSAYNVIRAGGTVDGSCNPFDWSSKTLFAKSPNIPWGRCLDFSSHLWKINQHNSFSSSSISEIKQKIMVEGPVTIVVPWTGTGSHAIVLVGWNDAEKVWLFKNSWGTNYEQNGYGKIPYTGSIHSKIIAIDWSSGVHKAGGP